MNAYGCSVDAESSGMAIAVVLEGADDVDEDVPSDGAVDATAIRVLLISFIWK